MTELLLSYHTYDPIDLPSIQQKIAQGSEEAFAKLYAYYKQRLVAFSFTLIRARESAEEVVEDVFIKLWLKRATLTAVENIAVYLYVAVKNTSLNRLSSKARQLITQPYDDVDSPAHISNVNPYELLITTEMLNQVNAAIEKLPPRCKMIFRLIREDNLKYKEVSEILHISINTIDVQMAIAVKRICEALNITKAQKPAEPPYTSTKKR